jgi:hypothetical protein
MTIFYCFFKVEPSQAMMEVCNRCERFMKAFQIFVHLQNMAGKLFPLRCRVELLAEHLPRISLFVHRRGRQPQGIIAMTEQEGMCMMVTVIVFMLFRFNNITISDNTTVLRPVPSQQNKISPLIPISTCFIDDLSTIQTTASSCNWTACLLHF